MWNIYLFFVKNEERYSVKTDTNTRIQKKTKCKKKITGFFNDIKLLSGCTVNYLENIYLRNTPPPNATFFCQHG